MKRYISFILSAALVLLSATACQKEKDPDPIQNETNYTVKAEYDMKDYLNPLWEGNIVTHESIMFMDSDESVFMNKITTDGTEKTSTEELFEDYALTKKLLYPADEIYAVYSADMKTEYIKGKDWDIYEGKIVRYRDSAIPLMTTDKYYPEKPNEGEAFDSTVEGHEKILFGESDTMIKWQVNVTYKHSATWEGPIPTAQTEKLKSFIEKLERGEEVTIVFYGDSITTGANSSGPIGVEPFNPSFAHMITDFIAEKYGYTVSKEADPFNFGLSETPFSGEKVIHYINTAVGGTTSKWGIENLEERVIAHKPDLMVLGFGMNEGGSSMEEFTGSISKLVGMVQAACPETDTVLVATMLPHFRVAGFYGKQYMHEEAFKNLVETSTELNTSKIAVAEVTSAHKYVLEHKEYYDMTGNNVNHPNDFLARIYATVILSTIFGDYTE